MKCLIPGQNVKILGRAIHALAKIGDDLYIESSQNNLILRSINSSDSAFCKMIYNKSFFTYYNHEYVKFDNDGDDLKCKISMKSALMVFKSPSQMDKQVEMCEIKLDLDGPKLVFQLKCKHGIIKTHYLSMLESRNMDVAYDINEIPNRFSSQYKVLSEAINNFQISEDQLTFDASPQMFILKNFANSNTDYAKATRTQLSIKPVEFDMYQIQLDSYITFSMKEFRAMLTFAEAINLPVYAYFESCGKPIIFVINNTTFEVDFVIATERSENTQSTTSTYIKNTSKRKFSNVENEEILLKKSREEQLDDDSELFNFIDLEIEANCEQRDNESSELTKLNNSQYLPISNTQVNKIKRVFKRCFDSTIDINYRSAHEILAGESDDE